jgi:hypothetical protein
MPTREFTMRIRPIHGAAIVFAAILVVTAGGAGPAQAFFFPLPMMQQSPGPVESGPSRGFNDNNRWRGRDRFRDDGGQPAKPYTSTRPKSDKSDEEKSSSSSSGKSGKSQAKSESSSSRTRSVKQEPPPKPEPSSKSSSRANASWHRSAPATASSAPPAAPPPQPSNATASTSAPETSPAPARAGTTLGDTFDEKLGEVFKARIDELLKQSN